MFTNPCTRTVCLHTRNAGANFYDISVSLVQVILAMSGAAATTATTESRLKAFLHLYQMIYIEQKQKQTVFIVRRWLSKLAERAGLEGKSVVGEGTTVCVLVVNLIRHCRSGAKSKLVSSTHAQLEASSTDISD